MLTEPALASTYNALLPPLASLHDDSGDCDLPAHALPSRAAFPSAEPGPAISLKPNPAVSIPDRLLIHSILCGRLLQLSAPLTCLAGLLGYHVSHPRLMRCCSAALPTVQGCRAMAGRLQVEDDEEGPLTIAGAPRLRRHGHVLEDTLHPDLSLDEPQKPEGPSSDSAADPMERPAALPVQAQDSGPCTEPHLEPASEQARESDNDMALGAMAATLEYAAAEATNTLSQPGGLLEAEQPDQAATYQQRQAAGPQPEVGRPSTQEPDQAADAWTPLSPQEGWSTKHRTRTPDALPAVKPRGKHRPFSMPHCPV